MSDIETLKAREAELADALEKVRIEREEQERMRENDPRQYIARLVYANKRNGGTYGYEYGDFGEGEYATADKIIETARGDIDVAAGFVTAFCLR